MSVEVLNSALMQLRGKAHEVYGLIKDIYRRPSQEGDADRVMNLSLQLAQLEGALLTLEQYAPEIIASIDAENSVTPEEDPAPSVDPPEEGPPNSIGPDELMERSSTYRKSQTQDVKRGPPPTKSKKS